MNESVVDGRDLAVLKDLLDEKIRKLEDILASGEMTGGPRDYYALRLEELRSMAERLRGR